MTQERWTIESPRFGTLEGESSALIEFDGLPGFANLRRFVLLEHDRHPGIGWLQSIEQPEVAFPVIDPRGMFPEYRPALRDAALRSLKADTTDTIEWLGIVTAREGSLTVNLAAPLLVNQRSRRGVQVILDGDGFSTREPLTAPAQTESKPQTKSGQGSTEDSVRS